MCNLLKTNDMLSEVNNDLYELCERAATAIIDRVRDMLTGTFAKLPVPESWSSKGLDYVDFLAYRVGSSTLEFVGTIRGQAYEGVRLEVSKFTDAERFAMASYFIELREAMAKDEDDPSPEANQVENPLPADEEIIELILSCWEDELYDRYEDIEHKVTDADAITMVEGRKPVHCPYCGGRVVPVVYGEPSEEVFDKHARGEVVLGGCCITGKDPKWECNKCGQWFRRK